MSSFFQYFYCFFFSIFQVAFKLTYSYKMIIAPIIRKLDEGVEKSIKQEEQLVSLDITVIANLGKM